MKFTVGNKDYESTFNYYSLDYANTMSLDEKCDDPIEVYNSILVYNKFDSLIQALMFIFAPKKNGGISRDKVLQGLSELEDNGSDIDTLIQDVIAEFEESGFFVKTIKMTNRMMRSMMTEMEGRKLDATEKVEMAEFQKQLKRAEEKGLI